MYLSLNNVDSSGNNSRFNALMYFLFSILFIEIRIREYLEEKNVRFLPMCSSLQQHHNSIDSAYYV